MVCQEKVTQAYWTDLYYLRFNDPSKEVIL